jgi:hypothetical protein
MTLFERKGEEQAADAARGSQKSESHDLISFVRKRDAGLPRRLGGRWGRTWNLDPDLAKNSDLIELHPGLGDLVFLKAIEDDGALSDRAAGGWNAAEWSSVRRGHGPARSALISLDDNVLHDKLMVGEHGMHAFNCLLDGCQASRISVRSMKDGIGCEDLRQDSGLVLVETLLVKTTDRCGLVLGDDRHRGSFGLGVQGKRKQEGCGQDWPEQ